ncbi:MAG TPA: hypothetical protein VKD70_19245 [Candidatus Acidoferrum sp.]|nr:hypothetical protein [Candidatus Acidoferrum sp.]
MRRTVELALCFFVFTVAAFGQNGAPKTTSTTIQCRPVDGSTTPIQSDEKLIGDQICRAVAAEKAAPAPVPTQTQPAPVPAPSAAPSTAEVLPNSVFIAPMNGFENYLAAALEKKKVPITVVADQSRAAYVITGTSEEKKPGAMKMLVFGQIHADNAASIQMVDQRTGAVVFAYAVNKKNTLHGDQTTAEACAKHLKEKLEKK